MPNKKSQLRILHVTKKYPDVLGGDAIVVSNLEKQQKKNGYQVFILTTNCDEIKDRNNLIKFGLKENSSSLDTITFKRIISLISLYFKSFKIIRTIKPDVVHSHLTVLGYVLSFACKWHRVPLVNTCHGVYFSHSEMGVIRGSSEKFFLKHSGFKKIFTVDITSLKDFKDLGIKNVVYTPNGVNLTNSFKKSRKFRDKTALVFVGRLEEDKGLRYLIEAIRILGNKNVEVRLIGTGNQEGYLKDLALKLGIDKNIKFLGRKNHEEIKNYYLDSDIFILPSIWEGFPITLLEAWESKLPVIITNVGGISKICQNKENALVIPAKNPRKIAEAIDLLIKNPRLAQKIADNGRKLVEEKYTWGIINKQIEGEYRK